MSQYFVPKFVHYLMDLTFVSFRRAEVFLHNNFSHLFQISLSLHGLGEQIALNKIVALFTIFGHKWCYELPIWQNSCYELITCEQGANQKARNAVTVIEYLIILVICFPPCILILSYLPSPGSSKLLHSFARDLEVLSSSHLVLCS